jgi:hypothetical protein
MSKYGNRKTVIDGYVFDSKLEADYYCQLKLLKRAGQITDFTLQPRFILQEAYVHRFTKKKIKKIEYVADFFVCYPNHQEIVDCKGIKTAVYLLKKKIFECKYPDLQIREVS